MKHYCACGAGLKDGRIVTKANGFVRISYICWKCLKTTIAVEEEGRYNP